MEAEKKREAENVAFERMKLLTNNLVHQEALGEYGFGAKRTYEQYLRFAGVDPIKHVQSSGDKCYNIKWIPFQVTTTDMER